MSTLQDSKTPAASSEPDEAILGPKAWNLPNFITVTRLLLSVWLFVVIDTGGKDLGLIAAPLFLVAAITDFLDGYIARKYKLVSVLGRILDPFADKIIICGTFLFLLSRRPESGVTAWMAVIVMGRELFVTALRSLLEKRGQDFSAVWLGKWKMVLQCAAVTASLLSFTPLARSIDGFVALRDILLWSAVGLTFYSGVSYFIRAARLTSNTSTSRS